MDNLTPAEKEKDNRKNCCLQSGENEKEDEKGILFVAIHPQGPFCCCCCCCVVGGCCGCGCGCGGTCGCGC